MYEGMGRKDVLLLGTMLMYFIMYPLPPLGLVIGLLTGSETSFLYGFVGTLLGMAIKRVSDHIGGQPWWLALFNRLAWLV